MISLIRPPAAESFRFATTSVSPPLGLAYIAGALEKAGWPVVVIDSVTSAPKQYRKYFKGYLIGLTQEEIVAKLSPDTTLIGLTASFTHEWPLIVQLTHALKRRFPDVPIVLGGEHVTAVPDFCLATSRADVIVLGEGEETVVELAKSIRDGTGFAEIAGIAYRTASEIRINPRRPRNLKIDDIPKPAWHHFDLKTYHAEGMCGGLYSASLTMPILATRGCPYQCTYCSAPEMWTPQWLARDPIKVADEIESYVHQYQARNFTFQDLTAIIKKQWIVDFASEIIRRKLAITWQLPSGTRSEAIDEEVAELLRESGMINMSYAPESGSDETRKLVKKKVTRERLAKSIQAAARSRLQVTIFMVIGFPHDRPEHIRENLSFIDECVKSGVSDMSVGYFVALPGTELFDSLYRANKIRLDRSYFLHILNSLGLVPTFSFCDSLPRSALAFWKFRLYWQFYGKRRATIKTSGLTKSVRRAFAGLSGDRAHRSKLETACRNAFSGAANTLRAQLRPRWIPRHEERAMFSDWDRTFRKLYEIKFAGSGGPVPADPTLLHKTNVSPRLKIEHSRRLSVPLRAVQEANPA